MSKNKFSYVGINPDQLRRAYGEGRIPVKFSLVPETFETMVEMEVIIAEINPTSGKTVAARGGNGSAFVDLGSSLLQYLYRDYGDDEDSARADALFLLRIIDRAIIKAEDTDVVKQNFLTLHRIISGERPTAKK